MYQTVNSFTGVYQTVNSFTGVRKKAIDRANEGCYTDDVRRISRLHRLTVKPMNTSRRLS